MSIFNSIKLSSNGRGGYNYVLMERIDYYSKRYNKRIVGKIGEFFDGATGGLDIDSRAWIVHDILCRDGTFNDGTKCTNWQASVILSDILKEDGKWFRRYTWFAATFLFGGGKARENSMF
jgi:hypothetical protein